MFKHFVLVAAKSILPLAALAGGLPLAALAGGLPLVTLAGGLPLVTLAGGVLLVFSAGCGHENAATQEVRSAAAVDLSCDASVIEFTEDTPMEKQVSGCGRTLTYMYKCNPTAGGGQDCRWKAVAVKPGE